MRTESRTAGLTLIEMLIAIALFGVVITVAFGVFSSTNRLVEADTGRINAAQNVQSAMDLLVSDLRQAGENLYSQNVRVTGLEFSDSDQTLTIRRAIPAFRPSELPSGYLGAASVQSRKICEVGSKAILIASNTGGCTYAPVNPTLPASDDTGVMAWRQYFTLQSGRPQAALLIRPAGGGLPAAVARATVTVIGAVQYTSNPLTSYDRKIWATLKDPVPADFTAANNSFLLLVDERTYLAKDGELRFTQGGAGATSQVMAFGVSSLRVNVTLNATTTSPASSVTSLTLADGADKWARIQNVNLQLTGASSAQGRSTTKVFTADVFPRNIETARGTAP